MATYSTLIEITGADSPERRISFENPADSGVIAIMHVPLRVVADQGFTVWHIERRDELTSKAAPSTGPAYKHDSADPSAACAVYFDTDGTQLEFQGSVTYARATQLDGSDGGDDSEDYPAKYLSAENALKVRPGESMAITLPEGEIPWIVEMTWEEVTL